MKCRVTPLAKGRTSTVASAIRLEVRACSGFTKRVATRAVARAATKSDTKQTARTVTRPGRPPPMAHHQPPTRAEKAWGYSPISPTHRR